MRGITGWQYRPFRRLYDADRLLLPYICRIAPGADRFLFEWLDPGADCGHEVYIRKFRSGESWRVLPAPERVMTVDGLIEDMDYEFKLIRTGTRLESDTRLVRTCDLGHTVVNYLHPEDPCYSFSGHALCSPSMARLPSGKLVAGMDVFAGNAGRNLTLLFVSEDDGKNWRYLCDIFPSFWPRLFVHRDALYLFSASTDYGDMLIGRSDDEGETWTPPVRLIPGCGVTNMGPHKGPMPITRYNGRIYTGIDYGAWKFFKHANGMLSIDENDDLLCAANWSYTPFTAYDPAWPGAPVGKCPGCIEGNAVVGPDGVIRDYLRIDLPDCVPPYGKAVILKGDRDDPEAPLTLDRIVDMPVGSNSKFHMLFDSVTGKYIAIGNETGPGLPQRTVLSMAVSEDFYHWRVARRLLDYRDQDPAHVAFQYPDWMIDGEDILLLSRTAYGRSYNYHDSNYITFHRFQNFRKYL